MVERINKTKHKNQIKKSETTPMAVSSGEGRREKIFSEEEPCESKYPDRDHDNSLNRNKTLGAFEAMGVEGEHVCAVDALGFIGRRVGSAFSQALVPGGGQSFQSFDLSQCSGELGFQLMDVVG